MLVWTYVPEGPGVPDCHIVIEGVDGSEIKWLVARTVGWMHGGKVLVRLCNPHSLLAGRLSHFRSPNSFLQIMRLIKIIALSK